jgi:hypothetical protein
MRIATVPSKRRKDLIIIAILLIGLPILVFASYQVYQLVIRASTEAQPKNVALSNITTSSVTVTWVTDVAATGSVIPIANEQEQSPVLDKRGGGRRKTHYVELVNLEPNKQYEFVIVSDSTKYNSEEEKSFVFKTAPITADTPTPNPIHGSVSGASGDDVIIFAMLKDKSAYPVSAIMPRGGNWIVDMSALRSVNDFSLVSTSSSTNIVLLAITGVEEGASVEGAYSELFDSNGKLKDIHALNVTQSPALYSNLPAASLLGVSVSATPTPIPTPDPPRIPTEPIEEEEFERRYSLKTDVQWMDMASAGGSVTGVTGEASIKTVNLTDTGFSVVWVSSSKEEGYIKYGTSANSLTLEGQDERDGITSKGSYYVHMVSAARLLPETEYFFEVVSGNQTYDNSGNKYRVTTFPTLPSPPPFDSVSGDVQNLPEHKEAVILAQVEDKDGVGSQGKSSEVGATVDENGRWILSIADTRTTDGLSYFEYTSEDVLNIDVLTTFPTSTHQEVMEGIGERDVEITLEEGQSVGYTKVSLLDNYGILGYSTGAPLQFEDVENGEPSYNVDQGIETPKTGIFDSYTTLSLFVVTLVSSMLLIYIFRMTKKTKRGNMKDSIR